MLIIDNRETIYGHKFYIGEDEWQLSTIRVIDGLADIVGDEIIEGMYYEFVVHNTKDNRDCRIWLDRYKPRSTKLDYCPYYILSVSWNTETFNLFTENIKDKMSVLANLNDILKTQYK